MPTGSTSFARLQYVQNYPKSWYPSTLKLEATPQSLINISSHVK